MSFTIGENVGPYRITAQLGQGGMATVFKAYHAALDRYVAVKALHAAFKEDPNFLARFQREAKIVAKLEHPHIVPIYDFSEHEGQPYLVMKFIEGETLKARLARGPLTIEEGVKVIEAVGSALAYAHQQGILHRDIKPSNILLMPDGGIFLSDFGLARIATMGETTLSQDMMVGTPHYISPEQAQGRKDLDAGTDIYSLGVVMYEIVVGRVPYSADTPFSIIHDHIYSPLPLPTAVNPNVPEAMERVLLKALAKKREDRYADVAALVTAFKEAAAQVASGVMGAARPAITPSQATAAPAKGMATDAPFAATQVKAAETAEAPAAESKPAPAAKPKRRPWWHFALAGGGAACGCLFLLATFVVVTAPSRNATQTAAALAALTATAPTQTASPALLPSHTPRPARPSLTPAPNDSVAVAETAVASHPNSADAWIGLTRAYFDAGRKDDARRAFQEGARLAEHQPGIYLRMVEALEFRDPGFALSLLANGLLANPDSRELRNAAYRPMFLVSNTDDGLPIIEDYETRFPDWALPHVAAAEYHISHDNPVRALREIDQARQIAPNSPEVQFATGQIEESRGNTAAALAAYEQVLANPDSPPFLISQARAHISGLLGTPTATRAP